MSLIHEVLTHMRADRWREAHNLVQDDGPELAAWLHGILHIQEGDLEVAEYWYGKANRPLRKRGSLKEELARLEAELAAT